MSWTSVKEKLPDYYETVLVLDAVEKTFNFAMYNKEKEWHDGKNIVNPTHWMSIPALNKIENQECPVLNCDFLLNEHEHLPGGKICLHDLILNKDEKINNVVDGNNKCPGIFCDCK